MHGQRVSPSFHANLSNVINICSSGLKRCEAHARLLQFPSELMARKLYAQMCVLLVFADLCASKVCMVFVRIARGVREHDNRRRAVVLVHQATKNVRAAEMTDASARLRQTLERCGENGGHKVARPVHGVRRANKGSFCFSGWTRLWVARLGQIVYGVIY